MPVVFAGIVLLDKVKPSLLETVLLRLYIQYIN